MTYLANHLPPEAIQSVLAAGLKTPLAAAPSELVHMGNAPTILPVPHATEITDEPPCSDDDETQMPQTGVGNRVWGICNGPPRNARGCRPGGPAQDGAESPLRLRTGSRARGGRLIAVGPSV